jgi:hypothetical protein
MMKPIYFPGNRDHNHRHGCTVVGEDLTITIKEDGDFSCDDPSAFDPQLLNKPVTNPSYFTVKVVGGERHVKLTVTTKSDPNGQDVDLHIHKRCKHPHDPID